MPRKTAGIHPAEAAFSPEKVPTPSKEQSRETPLHILMLMQFRSPTPGVRVARLAFPEYPKEEVQSCFRQLEALGALEVAACFDSDGTRFGGHLVGLTRLGAALLDSHLILDVAAFLAE